MRFEMLPVGPFMRDRSLHRGEIATDGAIRLMARHGATAVTLRALADEFNCTPQAVRQWFGGTDRGRRGHPRLAGHDAARPR